MRVSNSTIPFYLGVSNSWSYYDNGEQVTSLGALTEPLNVAARNGIDMVLKSLEQTYDPAFSFRKGSCANSSYEYTDHQRDHGTCFDTCHDPSTLFLPFNLEPCLGLATIAMLIENGTLEMDRSSVTQSAADYLGIGDLTNWDGSKVIADVVQCAASSCDDSPIGTCAPSVRGLEGITINAENLHDVFQRLDGFCDGVEAKLNPDIAGPGVMLSYLLQTCVALFLYLILKTLNSWSRIVAWPFILIIRKMFVPRRPSAWTRAIILQNRLARTQLNAATITSSVEFQEVQTFFVITIQIATLATSRIEGRASSGSDSFAEVLLNAQMVQSLAVYSVLPVVLTQCSLQREGMMWWYTFGLTSMTVMLAQIVLTPSMSRVSSFETLWQNFKESSPVEACGSLPNPMTYCNTDNYNFGYGDWKGTNVALAFIYIAVVSLLIDMLATVPRVQKTMNKYLYQVSLAASGHELSEFLFMLLKDQVWPCCLAFWWFGVQAGLLAFVVSYFAEVLVIVFSVNLGHFGNFNYGQLISVMVWAPTLAKFVYFSLFGIEEGFGRRLARNYRVVRDVYDRKTNAWEYGI
ncbi:hypothetical protein J7T55_009029 [Diaporthe amygdali]|uniref:uncharacterized protein n=1 Tax=Phomopsis amygdali TaxID=1214568 RepID=UPI0022FE7C3C|nr:uncharacterized protein J7T55_009029 [Diaporthe amygdali]KAJ0118246.1 hypothetical protein J7T55_009029 [Diaporthe amygdali]